MSQHPVPPELERLPHWAEDQTLCGRWAEVYPLWKLAYPLMDLHHEILKAYLWDRQQGGKVSDKGGFLNRWLARAYPDYQKRHAEEEAKRARDRRKLAASPTGNPHTKRVSCERCHDIGVVPATMTNRWGEEIPCMGRCPDCAFQRKVAQ